jgi:hypothetical protein
MIVPKLVCKMKLLKKLKEPGTGFVCKTHAWYVQ